MAKILKDVGFVHLHVHSSYSLLEGALKIKELVTDSDAITERPLSTVSRPANGRLAYALRTPSAAR